MALIKCIDCENMISEHVAACPFCGCPMSSILEKSKIEQSKELIEPKINAEAIHDLMKYRSLCKIPKEILEQMSLVSDEEKRLKELYDKAMGMMNVATTENQYKEAARLFEEICEYRNSASLAKRCYEVAEGIRKDADEQLLLCHRKIAGIKAKEEAERLDRERQEEIARQEAEEKRHKKIKKIAIACACVIVAIAIFAKCAMNPSMKDNIYDQEKMELLKFAEVGDSVYFGTYEQDNVVSNGKEKIEWIVLEKGDDRMLLLSKYALDCKSYHTTYEDITWEECTLRSWLNEDFMDEAFNNEEANMIPTVTVSADKNPDYDTNPGNATQDKVFLLSIKEVNEYFSADAQRKCKATDYAEEQGVWVNDSNGCVWWWLRSPGGNQLSAAHGGKYGGVDEYGGGVFSVTRAVRPALWINLDS